jgi:ribose transport system substrate-binding protein
MHPSKTEGKAGRLLCLLLVAGLVLSGLFLAACGSSSDDTSSGDTAAETSSEEGGSTEVSDEGEASGGDPETTVYAEGVPTLKELYESSNEPPPATGPAAAKGKKVIWVSCGQQAVGCKVAADGFLEAAKVLGWDASVIDGKLNVDNGFSTGIRSAIAAQPDAIITFGIGCSEVVTPLEEAKKAGIPVVETNSPDCSTEGGPKLYEVENQFNKGALSAIEFYEQYGENQAAYVIDKTEGKAKYIYNPLTAPLGQAIVRGWEKVFDKCDECELLGTAEWEPADQAPGGALEQRFLTALTKYPEANAAIIMFDSNATFGGMAKAVVDAGRQNDMIVVAGEGFDEVNKLIREKRGVTAEAGVWDQSKWFPFEVADQLNRHFNGEPSAPQGLGLAAFDLEGGDMPPEGKNYEAPIDYVKAYEEIWSGKKEG